MFLCYSTYLNWICGRDLATVLFTQAIAGELS